MALTLAPSTLQRLPALLIALGVSLAAGLFIEPWVGLMLGGFLTAAVLKPLEPVTALATLAAVASFVNNEGGRVTRDLSVVTLVAPYALVTLAAAYAKGRRRAPGGPVGLVPPGVA